ncbi:MAG: thymidylate synthase [Gaiellaceae bacterium]|jgi:thymidylate synthase (FAD)|nr:thymidylate synthase [Gaiellaceae bacterium]
MKIEVLDHGYVELIESWGSDERIIEAARMSTGKGFLGWGDRYQCTECRSISAEQEPWAVARCPLHPDATVAKLPGDEKLLRFLWQNSHATPFEMGGLVLEVQAPIFVFREWHRHRTQSYNELSARYTPLPDVNYVPTVERLMLNAGGSNKQAGTTAGSEQITERAAEEFRQRLTKIYGEQELLYQRALNILGVPKELARIHLPVGRYSRMRASANLRNWLAFLTLRMAPNAQWEIRQYANAVSEIVAGAFPRTHALFGEARTA